MEIKVIKIKLKAPKGSGAFLVKNLYLSCDPYMKGRMREIQDANHLFPPIVPGQVNPSSSLPLLLHLIHSCCEFSVVLANIVLSIVFLRPDKFYHNFDVVQVIGSLSFSYRFITLIFSIICN